MQVLFMDAHVLVTRCCSYPLYPWMLSLTPPALHSLHSICSRGVSASGGALGLFRLDVCMCQQGGEFLREVIEQGGVWFLNLLCTRLWECTILWELHMWGGNAFQGEFLLCLAPGFLVSSSFLHDYVEPCLCLWGVMFWLLIDCVEPLPLS